MVLGAIIGAVAGIGSSIFGASSANSAADRQYQEAKKQAQRQYEREVKEWKIDYASRMAQWQWDKARIKQLRLNEKIAERDYYNYNAKLIDNAIANLKINEVAIRDRFVTEERLRGFEAGQEYVYTTNKLGAESSEQLRAYLQSINQTALNSSQVVSRMTGETQELLGSLALDEQRDHLGWQLSEITAMARDAEAKGVAIVRQGGGATAQRLATEGAKEMGRRYGELVLQSQDRDLRIAMANRAMNNDASKQLAQNALSMQDAAERMKFTNLRYQADYGLAKSTMQNLTIPSFALAGKQGIRELAALRLQTKSVFDEATRPFRKQVFMDPLRPIAGLRPELVSPIKSSGVSTAGIIGNSLLAGFQGAMSFSYRNPQTGGLSFY